MVNSADNTAILSRTQPIINFISSVVYKEAIPSLEYEIVVFYSYLFLPKIFFTS
jgi:hypothetical protein